jgi:hypothetical protein
VERLENGNTLVVESAWGRALEVNKKAETVWEFITPHRSSDDPELIAVLFDMVRISQNAPLDWTQGAKKLR